MQGKIKCTVFFAFFSLQYVILSSIARIYCDFSEFINFVAVLFMFLLYIRLNELGECKRFLVKKKN